MKYKNNISKNKIINTWKALLILFVGIILTVFATFYTQQNVESRAKYEYSDICYEIETKINSRLNTQAQLLRAGSALFESSDTVTREEWKEFNKKTNIDINLPGIQGVGYSLIVSKEMLQQHINSIKKQGFPNYTIKPEGEREIYTSIIYIEPFEGKNLQTIGYDMFSEPIRRKAMELSRDSGEAIISGKVIQEQQINQKVQAATLMFVPVYKKEKPKNTVKQRRDAIKGWVFSPYRITDLMNGILLRRDSVNNQKIHLQIYDNIISANSLIFNSQENEISNCIELEERRIVIPINFNNHKWILNFTEHKKQFLFFQSSVSLVFCSGILTSLLLFLLIISLFNTKYRAREIAEKLNLELKESELRFKNMFAGHSSIMLLIEPDSGNIIDANIAAAQFYCYSIEELCTKSIDEINILSKEQIALERKSAKENHINYFVFTHKLATGEHRIVEVHSSPINIDKKTYLFSIIHDVTERKYDEELIKKITNELHVTLDTVSAGISHVKNRKIEWANSAYDKLFGYNVGGTIGLNTFDFFPNIDIFESYAQIAYSYMETGNTYYTEMEMRKKDDKIFWCSLTGRMVDSLNPEDVSIWMVQDITQRKITEKIIEKNNIELQKLNADKDRFISILAHDLKNPFSSILGFSDLLSKNARTYNIDKIERFANHINNSAKNTFKLLEDILLWARAQSGSIPFEPQNINFTRLCFEVVEIYTPIAFTKNIIISSDLNEKIPCFADINMLNTILRNLIANAIKFTNNGGFINK